MCGCQFFVQSIESLIAYFRSWWPTFWDKFSGQSSRGKQSKEKFVCTQLPTDAEQIYPKGRKLRLHQGGSL